MSENENASLPDGLGLAYAPDGRLVVLVLRTPQEFREWAYWTWLAEELPNSKDAAQARRNADEVAWRATQAAQKDAAEEEDDLSDLADIDELVPIFAGGVSG